MCLRHQAANNLQTSVRCKIFLLRFQDEKFKLEKKQDFENQSGSYVRMKMSQQGLETMTSKLVL